MSNQNSTSELTLKANVCNPEWLLRELIRVNEAHLETLKAYNTLFEKCNAGETQSVATDLKRVSSVSTSDVSEAHVAGVIQERDIALMCCHYLSMQVSEHAATRDVAVQELKRVSVAYNQLVCFEQKQQKAMLSQQHALQVQQCLLQSQLLRSQEEDAQRRTKPRESNRVTDYNYAPVNNNNNNNTYIRK